MIYRNTDIQFQDVGTVQF